MDQKFTYNQSPWNEAGRYQELNMAPRRSYKGKENYRLADRSIDTWSRVSVDVDSREKWAGLWVVDEGKKTTA